MQVLVHIHLYVVVGVEIRVHSSTMVQIYKTEAALLI